MSFIQRLVSPKLPTVLATQPHVELPGYELCLHNIFNVHVLPTALYVPKFDEALSKALQLYPHIAGQLRCSDERWFIELTNTAVPVEIDYKLDTTSDSLLNGDWVIQDDLSPLLNHGPIGASLVNTGAPLLRLKLTFFDNETCIGVSWHHTLGDALVALRFMHTLSQLYQALSPEYAAPTFKKHHFPIPSRSITDEFWPRMPPWPNTCLFAEHAEKVAESCEHVEHLKWRFDNHDLTELRSALSRQKETYLSKQDCLTAYLVTILNYNRSIPVQKVTTLSSYRNISASFVDQDVAGNLLQDVPATVPTDMAGIATALRHACIQCREPDYVYNWVSVASNHMLKTANAGKLFIYTTHDNAVTVNSNMVIDWCSVHFGFPDGTRFYTTGMAKLYLRCFRSNPMKRNDGVWQARQSVDVSIGVIAELKPKLLQTLTRGIQYVLNNEHTQTVTVGL